MLDFHNHLIPGVDDGAVDDDEAARALQAFSDQSILTIIATPHVQGSITLNAAELERRLGEIDAGWARLVALADDRFPDMALHRGAEVMLDTPQTVLDDTRLRLAGGHFALVEFPFMSIPPRSTGVIEFLVRNGVSPVIAHPERYVGMTPESMLPDEWKAAGALLQLNAGSLTGRYGPHARANAFSLLERGLIDYLCSDFHSRGAPSTAGACRILAELEAGEIRDLLTDVNPRRLLEGERPLFVPPLHRQKGWMGRIRQWLR